MSTSKYTKKKNEDKKMYKMLFNELMKNNTPITDKQTGEVFTPEKGEEFRQCYVNTKLRREFPTRWFVSDRGNLISVHGDKLYKIRPRKRHKDREYLSYCYQTQDGKDKDLYIHHLVAFVFHAEAVGQAKEILKTEGREAFKKELLNVHHIDGNPLNNHKDNLEIVMESYHRPLLDTLPQADAPAVEHQDYMKKINSHADKLPQDAITVIIPNENGSARITTTNTISFSPQAFQQLLSSLPMLYSTLPQHTD